MLCLPSLTPFASPIAITRHEQSFSSSTNGEYAFDVAEGFTLNRFRADIYGQALIDDLKDEQKTATADQMMEFLTGSEKFSIVLSGDRAYTEDELTPMVCLLL